jgi:hypothetical protein
MSIQIEFEGQEMWGKIEGSSKRFSICNMLLLNYPSHIYITGGFRTPYHRSDLP